MGWKLKRKLHNTVQIHIKIGLQPNIIDAQRRIAKGETARKGKTRRRLHHPHQSHCHRSERTKDQRGLRERGNKALSPEGRAAIALIFLNGGTVRSPVPLDKLTVAASAFGAESARTRSELEALNGSILNLAEDEDGPYWTYRHPTVGDAFASHVAKSPELVDLYLRGAKPETIISEVVCAGIKVRGAPVVVPTSLNKLLVGRIASLSTISLVSFISYRSNSAVTKMLLKQRPDLRKRIEWVASPLRDDLDVKFVLALSRRGLLTEQERLHFVEAVRRSAVDDADDSFIEVDEIRNLLEPQEYEDILLEARDTWMNDINSHVRKMQREWDNQYSPDEYFDRFSTSVGSFAAALGNQVDEQAIAATLHKSVSRAISQMFSEYEEPPHTSSPMQQSKSKRDSLEELFRDVQE
jgi:hypothetical protein